MKRRMLIVLLASQLFLVGVLLGQGKPLADLALELVKTPEGVTPVGSRGIITLKVTNLGPEVAGSLPAGDPATIDVSTTLPFTYEYGAPLTFLNLGEPGCGLTRLVLDPEPGMTQSQVFYLQFLSNLAPGASVTCNYEFLVNPLAQENIVNSWKVRSSNDDDPNPDNNQAIVVFNLGVSPTEIPTLSPIGLGILALGLLGAFHFIRRRKLAPGRSGGL